VDDLRHGFACDWVALVMGELVVQAISKKIFAHEELDKIFTV
jgi:hypothetical protein